MNTELEGVMRRVQKLLAIAQDDRADPNEAAAAAHQAEKIMRKYQIDHVDALRTDMKDKEAFGTMDCVAIMKRDVTGKGAHRNVKNPPWGQWLAYEVAKLNDCEIRLAFSDRGAVLRFFGYKADVQVAAWTFDYLVSQAIGSIRAYQKVRPRSKIESDSYRRGFILSVCNLLKAETNKKKAEMQAAVSSRALVVLKEQALAEHFGGFTYNSKKSNASIEGNAYAAGRAAGSKVSLTQGIGSNSSSDSLRIK